MSNTENVTITTAKNAVVVVLRPFITGYQKDHIDDAYLEAMDVSTEGGTAQTKIPATKSRERMNRAIEAVVISVNGITEDVVKQVLSLDAVDAEEVKSKVHEIIGDKKKGPAGNAQ